MASDTKQKIEAARMAVARALDGGKGIRDVTGVRASDETICLGFNYKDKYYLMGLVEVPDGTPLDTFTISDGYDDWDTDWLEERGFEHYGGDVWILDDGETYLSYCSGSSEPWVIGHYADESKRHQVVAIPLGWNLDTRADVREVAEALALDLENDEPGDSEDDEDE